MHTESHQMTWLGTPAKRPCVLNYWHKGQRTAQTHVRAQYLNYACHVSSSFLHDPLPLSHVSVPDARQGVLLGCRHYWASVVQLHGCENTSIATAPRPGPPHTPGVVCMLLQGLGFHALSEGRGARAPQRLPVEAGHVRGGRGRAVRDHALQQLAVGRLELLHLQA